MCKVKRSDRKYGHRAWSSGKSRLSRGLTLIELLVTLLILSILASAALPYAELTVRRNKELELHRGLRQIRTAIDRFHEDWRRDRISKLQNAASEDGYPKTLQILVEGVDEGRADGRKRKYLRRVPRDPFANPNVPSEERWVLRSYQDEPGTIGWGGQDVYDVHSVSEKTAIDGSVYEDW